MKIRIERIPEKEKVFIWAWIIYLIVKILGTSFYARFLPERVNLFLICLCIPLLMLHELVNLKTSYRELIGIVICVTLIIITMRLKFMGGGGSDIALMFTFIYCGRKISFERVANVTIKVTTIVVGIVILSGFLGIIDNYVEDGMRIRQYLGFRYSLFGPAFLFNVSLLILYIKQRDVLWREIIGIFFCNFLLYKWTDSRLSFGLTVLALMFAIVAKYKWKYFSHNHWWYWIMVFSFVICALFSFILTVCYDPENDFMSGLNELVGRRLSLGQTSLVKYGVNLWGQNIEWIGNGLDKFGQKTAGSYLYVDCLYIQLLQHYGIVFTSCIIILLTVMMFICYKQQYYYLMFMLCFVAAHCMMDDLSWQLYYNTFWFLSGMLLMQRKDKNYLNNLECKKMYATNDR